MIGGLYYRVSESFIPMVGYVYRNIRLMFTYDVTVSSLNKYNGSRGAWEFAAIQNGFYNEYSGDRHQSLCPSFKP